MSSYTDYTENNTQSNVNDGKKSTTSFGQPKNNILIFLAIALAMIVFIMVMCIIIVSFRRKLSRRRKDIGSITHLRNVDDEEYNSLDYYLNDYSNDRSNNNYSNDYSDEKKRRFTKPRLPKANMADLSMRENRNYKIYAKNNTTTYDDDDDNENDNIEVTVNTVIESNFTSNNNKNLKGIKSLSDIMKSSKNKFLARNNTTGNFDLKSKNDSSLEVRVSSPVTSVSTSYNNERTNSLADNSNSRIAPVIPPVPTIPSHKKLMEISRGSQMTTVSNDENNLNKTNHNTFTTINFSETSENITDNFTDNFSTTTYPYVISPKDFPAISHSASHGSKLKKNGKLQNMAIDSLYLLKRSNPNPFVPESQNSNKTKEKEEEKEYETNQEEEEKESKITKEGEDEDEENSNKAMVNEMTLSRESNLYRKNLYMIT